MGAACVIVTYTLPFPPDRRRINGAGFTSLKKADPAPFTHIGKRMAKWLITIGITLVVLGLLWPLLAKLGLGGLPGDVKIERKGFTFYFPVTTSILVSLAITLILWIFRR